MCIFIQSLNDHVEAEN